MASPQKKRVVLLGATGSIGDSTLRVIAAHADKLELVGIAARSGWEKLAVIAQAHRVPHVGIYDDDACASARPPVASPPARDFTAAIPGLVDLAQLPAADIVLVAVVGTTGLEPALRGTRGRRRLALASKGIAVLAGKFVMATAKKRGVGG